VSIRSAIHLLLPGVAVLLLAGGLALSRGVQGPLDDLGWLALGLAIIVTAALFGGHLAGRIGQPAVLGELLVGMLLGNLPGFGALRFVGADPYLDILSRIGMLLLLFEVGLDLSVRDLFAVGPSSLFVAVIGTASSLALGTGTAMLLMPGAPGVVHVFLGAAITATSVGITARVLKDLKASRSTEAKIILGAAVVDDVLALVVLGAVTAWVGAGQTPAGFGGTSIVALVMKTIGFLVLAIVLGMKLTPSWFRQAARLQTGGALLAVGLCFCFFLSWAASAIGLAALVGAFAAGLVLEETHSEVFVKRGERPLGELLQPMTSFLVPVFFVLVGFHTKVATLGRPALLAFAVALSLAAVLGKLSCVIGVVNRGVSRLAVAVGMIPRGEVTLVFAALGSALRVGPAPLLDERAYTALVTVVIVTTLVTPLALKWSMGATSGSPGITRPAA
jgi:Kef-type K+ transport system membrane component KefB